MQGARLLLLGCWFRTKEGTEKDLPWVMPAATMLGDRHAKTVAPQNHLGHLQTLPGKLSPGHLSQDGGLDLIDIEAYIRHLVFSHPFPTLQLFHLYTI
jgi:hypothetical protein